MAAPKSTIESIVSRFRREVMQRDNNVELEVRFQDVDYSNFVTIYDALRTSREGTLSQKVSVLMDTNTKRTHHYLRAARIREIHFIDGKKSHEKYVRKEPLML